MRAAAFIGAASGLLVAALIACPSCSSNKLTAQDATDVAAYTAQQSACVAALTPNRAAIDACRAKVKLTWAAKWNAEFDGGFGDTSTGGQ